MTDETFTYDQMVEDALRGVVIQVLQDASERGLPGNHHFYITFKTAYPGVQVPAYLAEKYPDEMTIVLQYQFWDLILEDELFTVTLSFNDVRERLIVPYAALTGFADPSVKFGLQFQVEMPDSGLTDTEKLPETGIDPVEDGVTPENVAPDLGQVVSLDQFRKKK
ncbi:MAG: hypothetical protein HOL85_03130 [Rhodospirillaceae bacterium]|jgi:uncharacterized protein|nr:hypothetical protein [Rhodospirillaceae bacterium]